MGDIPTEILKDSMNIIDDLTNLINYCFEKWIFSAELKIAYVSLLFKKNNSLDKENYKPVSILSHL